MSEKIAITTHWDMDDKDRDAPIVRTFEEYNLLSNDTKRAAAGGSGAGVGTGGSGGAGLAYLQQRALAKAKR